MCSQQLSAIWSALTCPRVKSRRTSNRTPPAFVGQQAARGKKNGDPSPTGVAQGPMALPVVTYLDGAIPVEREEAARPRGALVARGLSLASPSLPRSCSYQRDGRPCLSLSQCPPEPAPFGLRPRRTALRSAPSAARTLALSRRDGAWAFLGTVTACRKEARLYCSQGSPAAISPSI